MRPKARVRTFPGPNPEVHDLQQRLAIDSRGDRRNIHQMCGYLNGVSPPQRFPSQKRVELRRLRQAGRRLFNLRQ